jgi:uncharacterized protein
MKRSLLVLALLLCILGCSPRPALAPTSVGTAVLAPAAANSATSTAASPAPVSQPSSTAAGTQPASPTRMAASTTPPADLAGDPSATPVWDPMSIPALRAGSYPGSDIVIERDLGPGEGYHSYYAYYLSEGLKIYGLLLVPDGPAPAEGWPAIVFNHGYIPPQVYSSTDRYIPHAVYLAKAGYIVYKIDYRGHDRSEGVPRGAYGDPGYTVDVLNAVSSLKRFPQANPQKIGMWGHSMGGFLTLRAMVISRDIKAGVIWSGVVAPFRSMLYDWTDIHPAPTTAPDGFAWGADWIRKYGTPDQNPTFWNSISANSYLADLSGPLQLHYSRMDKDVPQEFSQDLAQAVEAVGKPVQLWTYEADDHNLSKSFGLAMQRTIDFYDQYLK